MSGIVAVVTPGGTSPSPATTARMIGAMRSRGGAQVDQAEIGVAGAPGASLGACAHDWESDVASLASELVARNDALTVVADATLYHVRDLVRALAAKGVTPRDRSPAALILAACAAFGDDAPAHLEGDFAFIAWDARRHTLIAARDFVGRRTLFYCVRDSQLFVASTVGALLAHPNVPRVVDLATLASVAAGIWTHTDATSHRGIRELRSAHRLSFSPGAPPATRPFWTPPLEIPTRRLSLEDGAAELRALLATATEERMASRGTTAVSLSGGWDSTAVYASGQSVSRAAGAAAHEHRIAPVSISYPPGDPGREDEIIGDVVAHWGGTTHWIDVDGIPLLHDAAAAAGRREQPLAHTYEQWNRALSRAARAEGARVILDGFGGDQLFQVSDVFLSDLFRRGQWIELARQFRIRSGGEGDVRSLYRRVIRPLLPAPAQRLIAAVRRTEPAAHYLDRRPPFWFTQGFLATHGVMEREQVHAPVLPRHDFVLSEAHAFLRFQFYPRIVGLLHAFGLEEGVEIRSPLLDPRVVRFALGRPWSERVDGAESKILLRRAMAGLLPAHVLAPRPHRTGVTSAYFLRQMRGAGRPLIEDMLEDSRLASIGMIDLRRLRRAWEHLLQRGDDELGVRLFFTLQAELWLRAQGGL